MLLEQEVQSVLDYCRNEGHDEIVSLLIKVNIHGSYSMYVGVILV